MTNKKISELPAVTTVAAGDLIPVVQGGTTKSATLTQVLASTSLALTVTTAQTNPYTANGNEFVPVDATSSPVTITLPTTPTNTTRVTVKKIDTSTNAVTISRGGTTDVFNKAGGSTSVSLTLQNQSITVQYAAGIWYVASGDLPLSQLDDRYTTPAAVAATYVTFKNFDGTAVSGKHVQITLTSDGTDISDIQVVTP